MKPTRSETRGTWLLAAVCSLAVCSAAVAGRCGRAEPLPDASPLEAAAADSLLRPAVEGRDTAPRAAAGPGENGRKNGGEKSRERRKPAPDAPSPLDRPVR